MCYMPIRVSGPGLFRVFSSASLLQTSVLRGRDSAKAAGCGLPDSFGDNLVVTHGHQDQYFGYYQVSLRDVNRACALTIFVNAFQKGKNKYLVIFFAFCYTAQELGGRDLFYK